MKKPVLAKSEDRAILAKHHPYSGEPEEWIRSAISFDFFIDWRNYEVQNEIWVKRLLEVGETPPITGIEAYLQYYDSSFEDTMYFAKRYSRDLHYFLIHDYQNWKDDSSILYDLHCREEKWICETMSLGDIKQRIYHLSGGETKMGPKGLIYSTSNLEAELSKTNYLWPGDVDGIILTKTDKRPYAILEYRKHTRSTLPESVYHYYMSGKDRRKYDRLQLLKDSINSELKLIVVTYPVLEGQKNLLLESVQVDVLRGKMEIEDSRLCPVPVKKGDNQAYKWTIQQMVCR